MLQQSDVEALVAQIRRLLGALEAGELTVSAAAEHRWEGALAVLEAVLERPSSLAEMVDLGGPPSLKANDPLI